MLLSQLAAAAGGGAAVLTVASITSLIRRRQQLLRLTTRAYLHVLYAALVALGMGETDLVYDPEVLSLDRVVVVSNHISALDWMVIWLTLERLGFDNVVFCARSLSGVLRPINVGMRALGFPVIEQRLDEDYITLTTAAGNFKHWQRYAVVIFPEGRLRNTLVKRSCGGAEPPPPVLPIKTRGFCVLMEALAGTVQGVIDCTLDFNDRGRLILPGPSRVVMRRVPHPHAEELPAWLENIFNVEKVALLQSIWAGETRPVCIAYPRMVHYNTCLLRLTYFLVRSRWLGFGLFVAALARLRRRRCKPCKTVPLPA